MPVIHQHNDFEFFIESNFQEPPYVRINKGKGFIITRIGSPEIELPHIEKHKNVSHEDLDLAFEIVNENQEKFLNAWRKFHNQRFKKEGVMAMSEVKIILRSKVKKEKVQAAIESVSDRRFQPLQKNLLRDLELSEFHSIDLMYYLRLAGWSHTGGSYLNSMVRVREMCKIIFGYEIPEKIGKFNVKDYRYRVIDSSQIVTKAILEYHKKRLSEL